MLFRLASWMILQATLILPIYIGLGLIQVQRYYQLQDYKPVEQKKYLQWAYQFLRITSWVYIPQKVIPAAFALYWLGMSEFTDLPLASVQPATISSQSPLPTLPTRRSNDTDISSTFCTVWDNVKHSPVGIVWLVIATVTISLLLFLQVFVISDSVTAMAA